ncbi:MULTISPECIES: ATP-binding protein [Sphingomonas]|uniref:ATP-binding protein n=1 Tax=Sphingomonas TaxID=13687 RepID=UPI0031DAFD2F
MDELPDVKELDALANVTGGNAVSSEMMVAEDPGAERPPVMPMEIQSGILKSLGINLYTNLGKVLVEFIANAYDGDASYVKVTIPEAEIAAERAAAKARADEEAAALADVQSGQVAMELPVAGVGVTAADITSPAPALNLESLFETLPDSIEVVIEDDGHGMSWQEVQRKFLPLNRQRRSNSKGKETELTSPGGRYVMGRKGVGKLAGFGAALTVRLWTKRAGETSATVITLVDEDLNHAGSIHNVRVPVEYEDGLDPSAHGTRINLSRLKADATRDPMDKIRKVIAKSFHAIRPEDFSIIVNDETLQFKLPDYEFIYPTSLTRDAIESGERAHETVPVPGVGALKFSYYVGFLARSHGSGADRGATIYCNNRLAAGPALFGLPTGMHSFHSVDYMDCVVEADDLDRSSIDFVNTARNGIKEGNEVVGAMLQQVVTVMKRAVAAHARFKKAEADRKILEDPQARIIAATLEMLPAKTRKAGAKLLQTIAQTFEVGTPEFEELAPTIMHSINATEVLISLASHGTDPATIAEIMGQLRQLSEIEKRDAIKLYRARRGGIEKLQILYDRGKENWKKKQFEKDLHQLLKENPWLIRPEFSTYISSDQNVNTTVAKLAQILKVDRFATIKDGEADTDVRPDLVFLLSDPMVEGPYTLKIVELKSPALPLTIEHWRQLENYVADVEEWCRTNLTHVVRVNGFLIGTMPEPNPSKRFEKMLIDKFVETGPGDQIQIIGLYELIKHARTVHVEAIKALERDIEEFGDDDDDVEAVVEEDAEEQDAGAGSLGGESVPVGG